MVLCQAPSLAYASASSFPSKPACALIQCNLNVCTLLATLFNAYLGKNAVSGQHEITEWNFSRPFPTAWNKCLTNSLYLRVGPNFTWFIITPFYTGNGLWQITCIVRMAFPCLTVSLAQSLLPYIYIGLYCMHMAFSCLTVSPVSPLSPVSLSLCLTFSPSHRVTVSPSHCLTGSLSEIPFYSHLVSNILSHCLSGSIATSLYPSSIILYTYGLPICIQYNMRGIVRQWDSILDTRWL